MPDSSLHMLGIVTLTFPPFDSRAWGFPAVSNPTPVFSPRESMGQSLLGYNRGITRSGTRLGNNTQTHTEVGDVPSRSRCYDWTPLILVFAAYGLGNNFLCWTSVPFHGVSGFSRYGTITESLEGTKQLIQFSEYDTVWTLSLACPLLGLFPTSHPLCLPHSLSVCTHIFEDFFMSTHDRHFSASFIVNLSSHFPLEAEIDGGLLKSLIFIASSLDIQPHFYLHSQVPS